MADQDHAQKVIFSHAEMIRDLLLGFIRQPWVLLLDFETLERVNNSFVSDDLRGREDDELGRGAGTGQLTARHPDVAGESVAALAVAGSRDAPVTRPGGG